MFSIFIEKFVIVSKLKVVVQERGLGTAHYLSVGGAG